MCKKSTYRLSGYNVFLVKADCLDDAFIIARAHSLVVFSGQSITDAEADKLIKDAGRESDAEIYLIMQVDALADSNKERSISAFHGWH